MKSVNAITEGALAVRFYQSVSGPFPVEIGAAVSRASLSVMIRPLAEPACADSLDEESMGVSLLEAEATGLQPQKVCDRLNALFAGRRVTCLSQAEADAMRQLFRFCALEPEFELDTLTSGQPGCTDQHPEAVARHISVSNCAFEPSRLR